ncbi:hypothetical protein B0H19DRAFT_1277614 [Mycena capillaripes]|nr:hypothetical protein B0H19DRAFT_1277614 [Mycena capillaripes]
MLKAAAFRLGLGLEECQAGPKAGSGPHVGSAWARLAEPKSRGFAASGPGRNITIPKSSPRRPTALAPPHHPLRRPTPSHHPHAAVFAPPSSSRPLSTPTKPDSWSCPTIPASPQLWPAPPQHPHIAPPTFDSAPLGAPPDFPTCAHPLAPLRLPRPPDTFVCCCVAPPCFSAAAINAASPPPPSISLTPLPAHSSTTSIPSFAYASTKGRLYPIAPWLLHHPLLPRFCHAPATLFVNGHHQHHNATHLSLCP